MGLDWIELELISRELNRDHAGARLQKIYQVHEDCWYFELYRDQTLRLFLNLHPGILALWPVEEKPDMPAEASAFCSLIRKHFENARFLRSSVQPGFRSLSLSFSTAEKEVAMIIELSSRAENLILLSCENAVKTVLGSFRKNRSFQKTGSVYESFSHPKKSFAELGLASDQFQEMVLKEDGFLAMKEIREMTPSLLSWLTECFSKGLGGDFFSLLTEALDNPLYTLICDQEGILDYSVLPMRAYCELEKNEQEENPVILSRFDGVLSLMQAFWGSFDEIRLLRKIKNQALFSLEREYKHVERKLAQFQDRLSQYRNWPRIEQIASLLQTQQEKIKPFSRTVNLIDYFCECREITVEIDAKLPPVENIKKYFSRAKKYKRGVEHTEKQASLLEENLKFLARTREQIKHETDWRRIEDKHQKLMNLGVLKPDQPKTFKESAKPKKQHLRMFFSSEQVEIYAGRNDKENDLLVKKIGKKDDLWFHIVDGSGAHILLKQSPKISEVSLREAAQLAAYLSSKKNETKAVVMYTPLRQVHSISGGNPGQVRVDDHKTITIRMDKGIVDKLEKNLLSAYEVSRKA